MTTIKQRRITKIVREFAKAQDSYDITGVDLSLSKFFYRASQELFQDLATGDYRIETSSGRQTLIITNQEILSVAEAFQVGYVLDFTATKYETQWNVDINTLKDKYNQLVDSTQELWEYIRKTGFISDDTTIDLILPQLDDEQLWYRVDGQYKALSLQDFRDLGERLIEAYVEYQKELFELMFRNARENIINTKDNSIKELQGILDALNINVDNFTGTKKAELQKMIDDFKAGLETIEVGNAHSLGGYTADKYQRKEDSELQTSSKIVVGAINELNDDIFDLNEAIDDIVLSKTSSEDTISDLMASRKYSIGDVVEVLGYNLADGKYHKRVVSQSQETGGVQMSNGLFANIYYDNFEDNRLSTVSKNHAAAINETYEETRKNSVDISGAVSNFKRPKMFWNSGSTISVGDVKFSMNGFRFMGRQYKTGIKNYYVESNQIGNGNFSICSNETDLEVCVNKPLESWVGVFAVKTGENTCRLKLVPFMQVLSTGGDYPNRVNLAKTKEGTYGTQTWDLDLKNDISNRDVLVITKGNSFYGKVHKIQQKYSDKSILTSDVLGLLKGDYLLIAPTNEEYCYLGSAYVDTKEFRNRSDSGQVIFSHGIAHPQIFSFNIYFDLLTYNVVSPLSSTIYTSVDFLSSNTKIGSSYVYSGGDDGHAFQKHVSLEKWVGKSIRLNSGIIKDNFDYKLQIGYRITSEVCSSESDATLRVWGYEEQ